MIADIKAYSSAKDLLHHAVTEDGFAASINNDINLIEISSRDGIICSLAALLSQDAKLIEAARQTIVTLAKHQTALGHIPAIVQRNGGINNSDFGSAAGRVDIIPWFIIGICNYAAITDDRAFADELRPAMDKCLLLMQAWEFNNRGLMYVPQTGDWADEYILHGYVLSDQVLRLWALRCYSTLFNDKATASKASELAELINFNFWPKKEGNKQNAFIPKIYNHFIEKIGEKNFWISSFYPSGYTYKFDVISNALCLMLNIGSDEQNEKLLNFAKDIPHSNPQGLIPSFWPSLQAGEKGWDELQLSFKNDFKNKPNEFQNGGIWPAQNAWWGAALSKFNRKDEAINLINNINSLNQKNPLSEDMWGFYENFHAFTGKPIGTSFCSRSAAGSVLLHHYLEGKSLFCL